MSPRGKGDARVALAVDLGGTKAAFAVVDATGAVRSRSTGAWEAEAAGLALGRRAEALLSEGKPSALREAWARGAGPLSAEQAAEAVRAGDEVARQAIGAHVEALALGIANLVSVLNPEVVVLGGGLMQARDLFLEPLRRDVPRWAQPRAARERRIEPTLLGDDASLFGAARLGLDAASSSS